ncbi:MAG: recombinase family protein [Phycisphaerales bacterium]
MSRRRISETELPSGLAHSANDASKKRIRCAIYTRKSSEEGLEQEFNSLDAQREGAQAFIASQKAEGWVCLPNAYDDGGFSGGSMERPALERLLRDVEAGKIDCVVVYKVDRLSRSLLDFARIMETFERRGVSFVSVTQQFNTTSSMGRLTLNVLLSFAQFEREIIGERIRDKLGALRRKGKWAGGAPILGYDVDRSGGSPKLVVDAEEAARVRQIFEWYLKHGSLYAVVEELERRNWCNKSRITSKGRVAGGRPFDRASLHVLMMNPVLIGKIVYKGQTYDGEHTPIIDQDLWDKVHRLMRYNGRTGGHEVRNKHGALLRGILRCKACDSAMAHTFSGGDKPKRYRYYRCIKSIKGVRSSCPGTTLPAAEIERLVVDEIRHLGSDKAVLTQVLLACQQHYERERAAMRKEVGDLKMERARREREVKELSSATNNQRGALDRLAHAQSRLSFIQQRLIEVETVLSEGESRLVSPEQAKTILKNFDKAWSELIPREQARFLSLLVECVEWNHKEGSVAMTFRPTAFAAMKRHNLEKAA